MGWSTLCGSVVQGEITSVSWSVKFAGDEGFGSFLECSPLVGDRDYEMIDEKLHIFSWIRRRWGLWILFRVLTTDQQLQLCITRKYGLQLPQLFGVSLGWNRKMISFPMVSSLFKDAGDEGGYQLVRDLQRRKNTRLVGRWKILVTLSAQGMSHHSRWQVCQFNDWMKWQHTQRRYRRIGMAKP